jgi:subtilisin family serine protease
VTASNYAYFDGTSMATPHVSAVAALVWSRNLNCTPLQLRNSLNKSAKDLGTAGRDNSYGFGLVQAKAADDRIKALGCGN